MTTSGESSGGAERFRRLRTILPVDELSRSFAVVGGSGALGNEVIKNLALLGVGNILVCDLDDVEIHNLTRSVLFRASDTGESKSHAAAKRVREIYSDANVIPFPYNIAELGLGYYRRADFIFTTFDAAFPRFVVNEACMTLGKVWVDGGMSMLDHRRGSVTVYDGRSRDNYCFTCGKNPERIAEQLNAMRGNLGCNDFETRMADAGSVPTTPMTASVIAGIQTTAAIEVYQMMRGGEDTQAGWLNREFELDLSRRTAVSKKKRRFPKCYFHDLLSIPSIEGELQEMSEWRSDRMTVRDLLSFAKDDIQSDNVAISLPEVMITVGCCAECNTEWPVFKPVSSVRLVVESQGCSKCGSQQFEEVLEHPRCTEIDDDFEWLDAPLSEAGIRQLDVLRIMGMSAEGEEQGSRLYELTGDAAAVGL